VLLPPASPPLVVGRGAVTRTRPQNFFCVSFVSYSFFPAIFVTAAYLSRQSSWRFRQARTSCRSHICGSREKIDSSDALAGKPASALPSCCYRHCLAFNGTPDCSSKQNTMESSRQRHAWPEPVPPAARDAGSRLCRVRHVASLLFAAFSLLPCPRTLSCKHNPSRLSACALCSSGCAGTTSAASVMLAQQSSEHNAFISFMSSRIDSCILPLAAFCPPTAAAESLPPPLPASAIFQRHAEAFFAIFKLWPTCFYVGYRIKSDMCGLRPPKWAE
jgi:hypothetical protein